VAVLGRAQDGQPAPGVVLGGDGNDGASGAEARGGWKKFCSGVARRGDEESEASMAETTGEKIG